MNGVSFLCAWKNSAHIFSANETSLFSQFATCVLASLSNFLPVYTVSLCRCSYIGELEEKARIVECLFY